MSCAALLARIAKPDRATIQNAGSGNLCPRHRRGLEAERAHLTVHVSTQGMAIMRDDLATVSPEFAAATARELRDSVFA